MNECPEPTARTVSPASAPRFTDSTSSPRPPGARSGPGRQRWSPAQFLHSLAIAGSLWQEAAGKRRSRAGVRHEKGSEGRVRPFDPTEPKDPWMSVLAWTPGSGR